MKNKGIVIFLILLAIVIIAIVAGDFLSNRPNKSEANPYEYNVDEFKNVPEELVKYKETKNFRFSFAQPRGFTVEGDKIYLVGDKALQIIDITGKLVSGIPLQGEPQTVEVTSSGIYVAFAKRILILDKKGNLLKEWDIPEENTLITAVAAGNGNVFVADAGKRRIIRFSEDGLKLGEFEGKASDESLHGFIIPSPYFDLDINPDGELWVVNPGMHMFENYTNDGNLRTFWKNTSMKTEGFSGCCNPAHYKFMADGSFVTSEKGLVRIKIYKPSGEFSCVVAPYSEFEPYEEAPDIAADDKGNIYALDFDRKVIRVFEPK